MKSVILFFLAQFSGEIIFNEIMYDPLPSNGLPEYEYLELFNRGNRAIDLYNWLLDAGGGELTFPPYILKPGEYVLLAFPGTSDMYPEAANIIELMKSKTELLNQGELLYLRDDEGNLVDWIEYSPTMHSDEYYSSGGWSLERIDPERLCGGTDNWATSRDKEGGTPGRQNSIFGSNPDYIHPEVSKIYVGDSNSVMLEFTEPMMPWPAIDPACYRIDNGLIEVIKIEVIGPQYREARLTLDRRLEEGKIYRIELTGALKDCSGLEMLLGQIYKFALPVRPTENSLLISEILFDPLPGCPEFVEMYNHSDKTIDLMDIRIARRDAGTGQVIKIVSPVTSNHLVFSGDYIVLSRDPIILQQCYFTGGRLVTVTDLPSFDNQSGNILVLDRWLNVIDELNYNSDMHFPLLSVVSGVSLERLSYDIPAMDLSNWHSASSMEGFATPGRKNSQQAGTGLHELAISIEPEIFSPDQDGIDDLCFIHYRFSKPGKILNVKIFDPGGRMIRKIAENELSGMEGFLTWDGIDMNGRLSRTGIYLVLVDVFDLQGKNLQYKRTCVLSPGR